jgi:hypothetical protein
MERQGMAALARGELVMGDRQVFPPDLARQGNRLSIQRIDFNCPKSREIRLMCERIHRCPGVFCLLITQLFTCSDNEILLVIDLHCSTSRGSLLFGKPGVIQLLFFHPFWRGNLGQRFLAQKSEREK